MIERTLFSADHEAFRDSFRRFMDKEIAPHHDAWEEQGYVDRAVWDKAGENGFLCMTLPEAYGGSDADKLYSVVQMEELARAGFSGIGYGLHSEIVAPYILHYGTEAQKQKYLPKLATGEMVGAIAMSEPAAGSDLQGVKTTAMLQADGTYLINGSKTFITNGWHADLVILVAKTDPAAGAKGTSLFLIERGMPGFEKGKRLKKLGLKAQDTSELFFDNVKVPRENLLGEEGTALKKMLKGLDGARVNIAMGAVGAAQAALDLSIDHARTRTQFGRPIGSFQLVQKLIVDMTVRVEAARALGLRAAAALDSGRDVRTAASIAKLYATEAAHEVASMALQVHGGLGYATDYPIERIFRDTRGGTIPEGTTEVQTLIVGREILGMSAIV